MRETGVAGYARTPGNRGVWMLRRNVDDRTEFVMFTLWDSLDAVKAFAGDDYETAVFYPEDDRFLIERDPRADHFEVEAYEAGADDRPALLRGDRAFSVWAAEGQQTLEIEPTQSCANQRWRPADLHE